MTDRNLFAPLRTDAELDAAFTPARYKETQMRDFVDTIAVKPMEYRPARTMPACTANACAEGRKQCPTPDACRIAEDDADAPVQALASWLIGCGLIGAIVLVLAAIFWSPM